ncbi:27560_t:CDS:2, partial [Racocetra persica]
MPRSKVTKACDTCRHLKAKCEKLDQGTKCSKCIKRNVECTYSVQQRRRGPKPKSPNDKNIPTISRDSSSNNNVILAFNREFSSNNNENILILSRNSSSNNYQQDDYDTSTSISLLPYSYENIPGHEEYI